MTDDRPAATLRLVLGPAILTLAVTALRLLGELFHWSPRLFSREAGGAGALVGIVWLVPVFGVWFALKLARAGQGPRSAGRAAMQALGGIMVSVPLAGVLMNTLGLQPPASIALFAVASLLGIAVAWPGWPELAKTLALYGLLARIPVALLMLVALFAEWGTHYEKGPPGFPAMGTFATWFWIGLLPQLTLWIAFTVAVGMLFGALAAAVHGAGPLGPRRG